MRSMFEHENLGFFSWIHHIQRYDGSNGKVGSNSKKFRKEGLYMTTNNVERMAYLIMVCPNANNNKFYRMTQLSGENSFEVEYGRIGSRGMKRRYPAADWHQKYHENQQCNPSHDKGGPELH